MKCLVTGGAGFLGSHVADSLLEMGQDVVVLDDLSGGFRENVPAGVELWDWSFTDPDAVEGVFNRSGPFDYVFHLGAYAAEGLSHHIRRFNYTNNVVGSVNLINAAVRHGVKCFVFTSSIAVYGSAPTPMREDMTPKPEDPYGIAKYCVELDLNAASKLWGMPFVILRPHNVYGERQNVADPYRNVVGIFMRAALEGKPMRIFGDGAQLRAFTHVSDVAPVIARAATVPAAYGGTFNLGSGVPNSVNFLAAAVAEAMGVPLQVEHVPERHEVKAAFCDHTHARNVLNAHSLVTLQDGLKLMAQWVRSTPMREPTKYRDIEVELGMPEVWK